MTGITRKCSITKGTWLYTRNGEAPYKAQLPTYWLWIERTVCDDGATANNQLTANPKDGKMPFLGSRPESTIAFQDLRSTSVTTW